MTITEFILSAMAGLRSLYAQSRCIFKQMRRLRLREAVKSSSPQHLCHIYDLQSINFILPFSNQCPGMPYSSPPPAPGKLPPSHLDWAHLLSPLWGLPHFLHTWLITSLLCCMAGGTLYPVWLCGVGFPTGLKVPVSWTAEASAYSSLSLSTTNNAQKMLVLNGLISSFIHSSIHSFKKPKKE